MDYLALIRSALKNKGTFEHLFETGCYRLRIKKGYKIDDSYIEPYVVYTTTSEEYFNYFIFRPKLLWERTKLLIMLMTAVLKVKRYD